MVKNCETCIKKDVCGKKEDYIEVMNNIQLCVLANPDIDLFVEVGCKNWYGESRLKSIKCQTPIKKELDALDISRKDSKKHKIKLIGKRGK